MHSSRLHENDRNKASWNEKLQKERVMESSLNVDDWPVSG